MTINPEIISYIETSILPQYTNFDKAHQTDHVQTVIQSSLDIAKDYDVNMNMVYVIAAYHDIGLVNGRKDHEKTSAAMLLTDQKLKTWFCTEELALMAQAVEDHRASNDYEPRSIYGRIVSEADRDIQYETIVRRTIEYSFKNYPAYTFEMHFTRCFNHIVEKYGESGYITLWLNTDKNLKNLEIIRKKIAQPQLFKNDFITIYNLCKANNL